MAVNLVMDVNGVTGESALDKHKNQIDILSWSWGMVQPSKMDFGGGGGAGKASFQDLSIMCNLDKATPALMKMCASGKHITEATLYVIVSGGDSTVDSVKYVMKDLVVTSVQVSGSSERPTVSVSFDASHVEFIYTPQDDTGAAEAEIPFKWNVKENKAA